MKTSVGYRTQAAIVWGLMMILMFSRYLPLLATAYISLAYILFDLFNFIRTNETRNDDADGRPSNHVTDSFFAVGLQIIVLGFLFLLSWYFFDYKLHLHL